MAARTGGLTERPPGGGRSAGTGLYFRPPRPWHDEEPPIDTNASLKAAVELHRGGRIDEAIATYEAALAVRPDHPDALMMLALAYVGTGRPREAIAPADRLVELRPYDGRAHEVMARALHDDSQIQRALHHARQAVRHAPDRAQAHFVAGTVLLTAGRREEAVDHFLQAMDLGLEDAPTIYGCGRALALTDRARAGVMYRRALEIDPTHTDARVYLANSLHEENPEEAIRLYEDALEREPGYATAIAGLIIVKSMICDWSDYDRRLEHFRAVIRHCRERGLSLPFPPGFAQRVDLDAESLFGVQRLHGLAISARTERLPALAPRSEGRLIRVGYLSNGFRDFPSAHLTCSMYRHHDRTRFEIHAFSYGPDDGSDFRRQIVAGVDRFHDIRRLDSRAAAEKIRAEGIDILVDMKAYSSGARPEIAAARPAPLQVNWLGYPGTWGDASVMDYILVDREVVPPGDARYYAEQLVYLPHCYQPTDDTIEPDRSTTRADWGLPEDAFVFATCNVGTKLQPRSFRLWLAIMEEVGGSVLWVIAHNELIARNLRAEAEALGVDPARVIFAERAPKVRHLGRLGLADLYLDSLPYCAHTTASDALRAGLPLLTMRGEHFAGRVAASILRTAGLPDLIVDDASAFRELAVALATDRERLASVRERVAAAHTTPMFDTAGYVAGLEDAYEQMIARYRAGGAPAPINLGAEPA